jgi:type II secretory pathway pseudopilin PulG
MKSAHSIISPTLRVGKHPHPERAGDDVLPQTKREVCATPTDLPWLLVSSPRRRRGYTLVEAMVALSLTAMAGAVVLRSIETSLDAADQALQQTIAAGLAEQLLDEALGAMYCAPGGDSQQFPLGADAWESQGAGRERFNEIGDYHGFAAQPPEDPWGSALGQGDEEGGLRHPNFRSRAGGFAAWKQEVEVYYVDENDPSVRLPASQTSNYRAVEVVIRRQVGNNGYLELARLRRVIANLPTVP